MDSLNGLNDDMDGIPATEPGWHDLTDIDYCNVRKETFRTFVNSGDGVYMILHVFSAGMYEGCSYYHTVLEDIIKNYRKTSPRPTVPFGTYRLMTKEEIESSYGIVL